MVIGPSVFSSVRDTVLSGVRKNLEAAGQCCNKSSSSSELTPVSVTSLTIMKRHIVCRIMAVSLVVFTVVTAM